MNIKLKEDNEVQLLSKDMSFSFYDNENNFCEIKMKEIPNYINGGKYIETCLSLEEHLQMINLCISSMKKNIKILENERKNLRKLKKSKEYRSVCE